MSETAWYSDGHGGSIECQWDARSGVWVVVRRSRESHPPSLLGQPQEEPSQPGRPILVNPYERRQRDLAIWRQSINARQSSGRDKLCSEIESKMNSEWTATASRKTGRTTSQATESVVDQATRDFPLAFHTTANHVQSLFRDPAKTLPSASHKVDRVSVTVGRYHDVYDVDVEYTLALSDRGTSVGPHKVSRSFPVKKK